MTIVTYTLTLESGETIELSRDVRHQHPAEVHAALGTRSEAELQHYLDNVSDREAWYHFDGTHRGPDCTGLSVVIKIDK